MLKPFSMIFFVMVMVWCGAIFLTSNPTARIERACVPVTVADKVVVALVQLIHEPYALDAHQMMLTAEYSCRYTVWKTFYEEVLDQPGNSKSYEMPEKDAAPRDQRSAAEATRHHQPKQTDKASADEPKLVQPMLTVEIQAPPKDSEPKVLPSYMDSK